eukprot:2455540-Pleurochrysis_carterae.AAC.2
MHHQSHKEHEVAASPAHRQTTRLAPSPFAPTRRAQNAITSSRATSDQDTDQAVYEQPGWPSCRCSTQGKWRCPMKKGRQSCRN